MSYNTAFYTAGNSERSVCSGLSHGVTARIHAVNDVVLRLFSL